MDDGLPWVFALLMAPVRRARVELDTSCAQATLAYGSPSGSQISCAQATLAYGAAFGSQISCAQAIVAYESTMPAQLEREPRRTCAGAAPSRRRSPTHKKSRLRGVTSEDRPAPNRLPGQDEAEDEDGGRGNERSSGGEASQDRSARL